MSIADKTRKALWARSGNRCAICRIELVQQITQENEKLIIGEECHIISSKRSGPRGNLEHIGDFDHLDNLILLCANDHKRIDDLVDIYTVQKVKLLKETHENWVKTTLERDALAFTNDKQGIKSLPKIFSGKQIVDIIKGAHFFEFDFEELQTENEAEQIGGLLEDFKEYGDILEDLSVTDIAKLGIRYNEELKQIETAGYYLFGLRRKILIQHSTKESPSIYDVATLIIVKQSNPAIVGDFLIAKFPSKTEISF